MRIKRFTPNKARIEMMPLIDSFFLILIYFIVTFLSMSLHKGIPLNLPQATTSVEQPSEHIGVSITKTGDIFLDKTPVTKEELISQLTSLKDTIIQEEKLLYIYGDKEASHGRVIEVFDVIRKIGIEKVFIETQVPSDES